MRFSQKVLLFGAVLAGMALAATGATADTCTAGSYTISTSGPSVVGLDTQITYTISGSPTPDHVATVVASGSTDCFTTSILSVTGTPITGNQSYPPAVGDPVTGLGKWACHEEAAKVNPQGSVSTQFMITVSGIRNPTPKSVVVKKGNKINSCEIVGIGEQSVDTPAPVTETIKEPDSNCAVEFTLDRVTGKVLHAEVTSGSDSDCHLTETPVENLSLEVSTPVGICTNPPCSLGAAQFGEGYVHSGSNSCTTRIIGGKLYSWGAPCP